MMLCRTNLKYIFILNFHMVFIIVTMSLLVSASPIMVSYINNCTIIVKSNYILKKFLYSFCLWIQIFAIMWHYLHNMMGYINGIDLITFILLLFFTIRSECIIIVCITNETVIADNSTILPSNNIEPIFYTD